MAVRLRAHVTEDRRLVVDIPDELPPGPVELIVLHDEPSPARRIKRPDDHPLFGMWADRPEAADPIAFVRSLRQKIELRRDGDA